MQSAIDLKVWKELAISKQLLIRTATDALGLDPEIQEDELKIALVDGVKKIANAESLVELSKSASLAAIQEIEAKLADTQKSLMIEEGRYKDMAVKKDSLDKLLETTRKISAEELKEANAQLESKIKELKSIKTALADTPENVIKKLKSLNKKKFDETTARKRAEDETRGLRKEKQELKDKVSKLEATIDDAAKLAEKYRALQTFCDTQFTELKKLSEDESELTMPPKLDEDLLKGLEKTSDESEDDSTKDKKDKKEKKQKKTKKAAK